MGTRAVDGGARRWKAVQVGGGVAVLAGVLFALPDLHRPPPPSTALDRADIHAEYVKFPSGRDTVTAYLAYPERKDPAPAVVVIHEIFGLSDFIRQTTEQLAKDGFVAIAPDLLSRRGGTPASPDDARKLIAGLDPDTITKDLDATVAYVKRVKAARPDRLGIIGFCWGGGQSFRYATNNPSLGAFVVCYGPGPDGLADVDAAIRTYHKSYRHTVYPGVGHGFLRAREKPEVADSAWRDVIRFFRESLEP